MVLIINYGIGNLASIFNMLKKIGCESLISNDAEMVKRANKIILPGIGAFDHCMNEFNASGLRTIIEKKVFEELTPLLGVCVGSQMLVEKSEEGNKPGLGWIKGEVIRFKKENLPGNHKIPHMGWTDVTPENSSRLYDGIQDPRFYFVHSYHIVVDNHANVTATAEYGYQFNASVGSRNIQGVQFHPEKSHKFGMQLYSNFVNNF